METTFSELTTMGLVGFIGILLWQLVVVHRRYNHLGAQYHEQDQSITSLSEQLQAALQTLDTQQAGDSQERLQWQQRVEALEAEISQMQGTHASLQRRHTSLEQDLLQKINAVQTFEEQARQLSQENSSLRHHLKTKQENLEALQQRFLDRQVQTQELVTYYQQSQTKLASLETQVKTLSQAKRQLELDLQRKMEQEIILEQRLQQFEASAVDLDLPPRSFAYGLPIEWEEENGDGDPFEHRQILEPVLPKF